MVPLKSEDEAFWAASPDSQEYRSDFLERQSLDKIVKLKEQAADFIGSQGQLEHTYDLNLFLESMSQSSSHSSGSCSS